MTSIRQLEFGGSVGSSVRQKCTSIASRRTPPYSIITRDRKDGPFPSEMTMKLPIYLDYSATTPVDPRVVEKMLPWLTSRFGNPASSTHAFGWSAREAVEQARELFRGHRGPEPGAGAALRDGVEQVRQRRCLVDHRHDDGCWNQISAGSGLRHRYQSQSPFSF